MKHNVGEKEKQILDQIDTETLYADYVWALRNQTEDVNYNKVDKVEKL